MRLFIPSVTIDPNEGFTPEKDIFNLAPFGQGLTRLIENSDDPLVIAINGPWGTGKSTFMLMWAGELRKAGYPVIYFDAFAHDYVEDAFTALAGEIIDLAKSNLKPAASKKIKDAAVSAGKILMKVGAAVGVRAATAGFLAANDLGDIAKDAKDAIGDAADKVIEEAIATRKKQRDTLEAFRATLGELPNLLDKSGKPLVFIIDELDRCKPPFALALLERMKHFFAVKGVHFILGTNLEQLENSVAVTYGNGIDAHLYLQKFISLTADLNMPADYVHEDPVYKYLRYLEAQMQFRPEDSETLGYTTELIAELARNKGLKLRTLEKIMSVLAISLAYTSANYMRLPPILAGLCVMKVVDPSLYEKARMGKLTYQEAAAFFDLEKTPAETSDKWPPMYFVKWWRYALDPTLDAQSAAEMDRAMYSYSARTRNKIVQLTANQVIDRFARGAPRS